MRGEYGMGRDMSDICLIDYIYGLLQSDVPVLYDDIPARIRGGGYLENMCMWGGYDGEGWGDGFLQNSMSCVSPGSL